jgi:hypothetical protein
MEASSPKRLRKQAHDLVGMMKQEAGMKETVSLESS